MIVSLSAHADVSLELGRKHTKSGSAAYFLLSAIVVYMVLRFIK